MDSFNIKTGTFSLEPHTQKDLPIDDIIFSNPEPQNSSVLVQNCVIKHLDDGNLELLFCSIEDSDETTKRTLDNISELDSGQITKPHDAIEFDLDEDVNNLELGTRLIELPVIRNPEKDSVIQYSSTLTEKPEDISSQIKSPFNQIPILSKPERLLLNITIYSCFKCQEQFKSLTLFRQHLKWHKAEKKFNCTKCSVGYNAENNLKIHMVTSHPGYHTDVCPICKVRFQRKASLKSHILIHQVEELFTCDECRGEFQNDEELLKHMEVHAVTRVTKTLSDALICPYCKLDFKTLQEYKQHIAKHLEVKRNVLKGKRIRRRRSKENPGGRWKCKYCAKVFSKSCLLERHERVHTGEKPYGCPFCHRAFAQKGTMQIHLGSHTGVKPYACTLCQAKFTQKGNLRAHIEKTHTAPKGNQKMYKCTQCPCIFRKVASLNGHITKVHLNQVGKDVDNIIDTVMDKLKMLNSELGKSALKKDEQKSSVASPTKTEGMGSVKVAESHANGGIRRYIVKQKKIGDIRWYFCNYCPSRFKKPSDLIRHFRTHTLEKPYKCTKCNHAFSLKSTLINHYKTHGTFRSPKLKHHNVKIIAPNYFCSVCDEMFLTLEAAEKHRLTHKGEMDGKQNIIEPILEQPVFETTYGSLPLKPPKPKVPNSGQESPLERPHHCKLCDARFTRLMCLKRHMLGHSGERKHKCNLCPKAFLTKYGLKEHTNYHKNIRNYGCQTCGKKFVTTSLLKRHMIVHNNYKPYRCPHCDKHFKTSLLSRSHIKTAHKLEVFEMQDEEPSHEGKILDSTRDKMAESDGPVSITKISNATEEQSLTTNEPDESAGTPIVNAQQNSIVLSVTPQENQQETNPGYQMVYLNIGDLPSNSDSLLNGSNLLSALKIQSDSLLYNPLNDLQDSAVLFNIDTNKSEMVDPNEVIKSTSSNYGSSAISKGSQNTSNASKLSDLATRQREDVDKRGNDGNGLGKDQTLSLSLTEVGGLAAGHQGVSLQNFSALDLGGLPISIIGADDAGTLTSNIVSSEMNMNPNDMFYNAQVICINCHKMFSDMTVFQKHMCSVDAGSNLSDNINLLIEEQNGSRKPSEGVNKNFAETPTKEEKNYFIKSTDSNYESRVIKNAMKKIDYDDDDRLNELPPSPVYSFESLKRFKYKKSLLKDLERMEKSREFRCSQCGFVTFIEERFRKHMTFMHNQSMNKVCKYCFKEFKKNSDLQRHIRTHTGERPFECDICHKKFSLKSTLESHSRTHDISSVQRISCAICNSNFTTKSSLKVHMLLHTGVRPHACTFCDQSFRTSAIRRAHEKNTHLSKTKQSSASKPKIGRKLLKSMAEEVANELKMNKTAPSQPTSRTIILNAPPQESLPLDSVILLQQLHNSGIIITTDNGGDVPVNLTDLTLLDYVNPKTNSIANGNNISFDVDSFQLNELGKNHPADDGVEYVQNGAKSDQSSKQQPKVVQKVECDICHKMYASKDVLRKHKKNVHGQNKKFPCIKCDKGYDSLEELNKHIVKLHTGHRPYACPYCANSFSEENSLKTHIKRIHQKSVVAQETTNALLGLQFDLPIVPAENTLI